MSGYVRYNFVALIVWTLISWKIIWVVINLLPHKTRSPSKYSRLEIAWEIPISWEQLLTCLIAIDMDVGVTNHTLISGCNQLEVIVVWLFNLNLDFRRRYISKLLKFELYFCTEVIMQSFASWVVDTSRSYHYNQLEFLFLTYIIFSLASYNAYICCAYTICRE